MTGLENRTSEDGIIDEALSTPNEVRNHENYFHLINDSIATTLKSSSVNYLLLFIPLGILSSKLNWSPSLIFTTNFLAIIPLASILAFATEQLGDTLNNNSIAGLLNATFGNAVEVIVSIIALKQNQVTVVQASMLGSILSNLLLVLGSCFIVGGLKFKQQSFNQTAAQTMGSLLAVSVMTLLLPAAFYLSVPKDTKNLDLKILDLSRGTSVILLVVYGFYMVFQLKTHYFLFADDESDIDEGQNALQLDNDEVPAPFYGSTSNDVESQLSNNSRRSSIISRPKSVHNLQHNDYQLSTFGSILILLLSTIFVSICADYLVSTIDEIVESSGLSKTFIGLIIIPIVGNAAEHVTAIYVAYKNKMDLAIGVAIGSSLQIAIFVTPFLVLVGWFMDVPMSLYFSCFETAVIFVSVFITNSLILDGSSNWLEGVLLISTYLIIAIAFFLFPDTLGE